MTPERELLREAYRILKRHYHAPALRKKIDALLALPATAAIVQVLPLPPQPETVTTSTHGPSSSNSEAAMGATCEAAVVDCPGIGKMKWCEQCAIYFGKDQPCPSSKETNYEAPRNDCVICPACCHQFGAISVDDQDHRARLERELAGANALGMLRIRELEEDYEHISSQLAEALDRERLANMRATEWEEAAADTADRLEVCGKMLEGVAEVRDELKAELKQARDLANRETLSANYWKDRASSVSARGALPESLLKRLEAASAEARRLWHHRVSGNHIDSIDLNDLSFSLSELLKDARADNCKAQEGKDG